MSTTGSFKEDHTFEQRLEESERIRKKYPDRVPVIIELEERDGNTLGTLDKKKYLVPQDLTVTQFVYVIRRRMKLNTETAMFMFIDKILAPMDSVMEHLYNEHKANDGFLYMTIAGDSAFGQDSREDHGTVQ